MALHRLTSKSIITGSHPHPHPHPHPFFKNAWFCRGFVSATTPSREAKVDKETCGKIIEAAEAVKKGTQDVVNEAKRVGGKVANATQHMVVEGAKKGFEKASEKVETKNTKDLLDTGKAAAEAVKEKVDKKEK